MNLPKHPDMKLYVYLYHCELNPIELCWSQVKGHIKKHNQKFTLSAVKDLTYEGFRRVGAEQWRKNISYVRDKIDWIADILYEELIIHFGGQSDELSEEESSNSGGSISSDGE